MIDIATYHAKLAIRAAEHRAREAAKASELARVQREVEETNAAYIADMKIASPEDAA